MLFTVDSARTPEVDGSEFTFRFLNGGIDVSSGDYSLALISAAVPNTAPNVSAELQTNVIEVKRNTADAYTTFTLPDGRYSIADINEQLHAQFYELGWYYGTASDPQFSFRIRPNAATARFIMEFVPPASSGETGATEYFIRFPAAARMHTLLGWNAGDIVQGTDSLAARSSPNAPDMSQGRDVYTLNCDAIERSYLPGGYGSALFSFVPSIQPGYVQAVEPHHPVRHKLNRNKLQQLKFRWTDSLGRPLPLRGEQVQLNLELRREK